MKKLSIVLFAFFISFTTFAQKDEIKNMEKAFKKNDYPAAKSATAQAEGLLSSMDDKTKAKFYYLKGEIYAGLAKTDSSSENFVLAADSFSTLSEIEKSLGSTKYTDLAAPTLEVLIADIRTKGAESYQKKNYIDAKKELYLAYTLIPIDTLLLEYAANAAYLGKELDVSLEYFNRLWDMGYTGITTIYSVKNVETGKRENVSSESQMNLMVKAKEYEAPEIKMTDSKQSTIIKNIASIYNEKGENEKAIDAFKKARKILPNDAILIQNEAVLHYKMGDLDEYVRLINEAIKLDPNNATLYFNLGVISSEQGDIEKAKEYYYKAIELKSDYKDAYVNLGSAILEKDKLLVEEMNENLSNFDKYDEIKARQVELYEEVIPIYEKAYELMPDDIDTVRTLMSLYENIEMDEKYKEMRALYDSLK